MEVSNRQIQGLLLEPSSLPSLGPVVSWGAQRLELRMTPGSPSLGPPLALALALRSGAPLPRPCLCDPLAVAICLVTVWGTWSPFGQPEETEDQWVRCQAPSGDDSWARHGNLALRSCQLRYASLSQDWDLGG